MSHGAICHLPQTGQNTTYVATATDVIFGGMLARWQAVSGSLGGHYWTLRPFASGRYEATRPCVTPPRQAGIPPLTAWTTEVEDGVWGALRLSGWLHAPASARALLLVVHGLGGNADSLYSSRAVGAALARGWACLRISLRGADGGGGGFYHAALTDDLHAALESPMLAGFDDVYVIGYSLGGHLALRFASEAHDRRVRSVAAVCAPIDLGRSVLALDRPGCWPYRFYVLRRLKQCYAAVARLRPVPTPFETVRAVRFLRDWDACTVVPRYGFSSPEDYYARASAAGRLTALRVPALLVNTDHDPMVPASTVRPALPAAAPALDVRWLRTGGHVGFPPDTDLGEPTGRGLERQIASWLERAGARG